MARIATAGRRPPVFLARRLQASARGRRLELDSVKDRALITTRLVLLTEVLRRKRGRVPPTSARRSVQPNSAETVNSRVPLCPPIPLPTDGIADLSFMGRAHPPPGTR